jgi:hypothetical protein
MRTTKLFLFSKKNRKTGFFKNPEKQNLTRPDKEIMDCVWLIYITVILGLEVLVFFAVTYLMFYVLGQKK